MTPAIPPKMYRHFALVTVLLTAAMTMFATGENRKAAVVDVEATGERREAQEADPPRFEARNGDDPAPVVGSFGDDDGIVFGRPMDNPVGGLKSSVIAKLDGAEAVGYPPEYLASLPPAERELLLKGLEESGLLTEEARVQRAVSLESASRRRSGVPTG